MNTEGLPESLRGYAAKLESENTIDLTEMLMAFGRALKPVEEAIEPMQGSLKALQEYIKRPWWKKLFDLK